jgi:FKBP-type peptidyl-prolyl cis-trans isomerase (trigger factor)
MSKQNQKEVKQPTTNPPSGGQSLTTKLTWLPKKTFILEFSIPWAQVKETYQQTLGQVVEQTTLKGFRKGKAPIDMVEKNTDKAKLYEEVIRKLLPISYDAAVKQHRLMPIINPKIDVVNLKENSDWQFKATACERPAVKLGTYQQVVKGELAKTKIWLPGSRSLGEGATPGKGKPDEEKNQEQSYDEKLKIVTQSLLKNIQLEVADMLVEDEASRLLSRLLDQVTALGMTVEQYLSSKGLTKDQVKHQYTHQAEDTLKLEFILQAVVEDQRIKVDAPEIEKIIQTTPDEKTREQLSQPVQKAYLAAMLAKRKALDYLLSL